MKDGQDFGMAFNHSFFQSICVKCSHIPDPVLGARNKAVDKRVPVHRELTCEEGERQ